MRIQYDEMLMRFKTVLMDKGFSEADALNAGQVFANNSLDGIYSHGVNRFATVISQIDKGHIDIKSKAQKVEGLGPYEIWDGNLGLGIINAQMAMDRAIELAKTHGIGLIALRNTNHWMRGGSYGIQAADANCIGICWTNTLPNMPPWGSAEPKIGNNPLVFAIPRENGEHVVVDSAMSQFAYGKIEESRLANKELPIFGGYNKEGELTQKPKEIEETGRILPMGYWKGSSISIALDLISSILSLGKSTTAIGKECDGQEYGLSQTFIAIDPFAYNSSEGVNTIIEDVISDITGATPIDNDNKVRYPGARAVKVREDNLKNGIPVAKVIWDAIMDL